MKLALKEIDIGFVTFPYFFAFCRFQKDHVSSQYNFLFCFHLFCSITGWIFFECVNNEGLVSHIEGILVKKSRRRR